MKYTETEAQLLATRLELAGVLSTDEIEAWAAEMQTQDKPEWTEEQLARIRAYRTPWYRVFDGLRTWLARGTDRLTDALLGG